jgi:hypothetical protein
MNIATLGTHGALIAKNGLCGPVQLIEQELRAESTPVFLFCLLFLYCFLKELDQVVLPDRRHGVCAVSACGV